MILHQLHQYTRYKQCIRNVFACIYCAPNALHDLITTVIMHYNTYPFHSEQNVQFSADADVYMDKK